MEFFRQEYWTRYPFPFPEDLPGPGIEPRSPTLQADSLPSEPPGKSFSQAITGQALCLKGSSRPEGKCDYCLQL